MRAVLTFALVGMLAPAASAGTQQEPELRDPDGDIEYGGLLPMPAGPVAGMLDLLKVWIDGETATDIAVNFEVQDASSYDLVARHPGIDIRVGMFFHLDHAPDETWFVARYTRFDSDQWFLWQFGSDGTNMGQFPVEGSLQRNVYRFQMARADMGLPPAGSALVIEDARATANPTAAAGLYHFGDYAPANGEKYTFIQGLPPAETLNGMDKQAAPADASDDEAASSPAKDAPGLAGLVLAGTLLAVGLARRR